MKLCVHNNFPQIFRILCYCSPNSKGYKNFNKVKKNVQTLNLLNQLKIVLFDRIIQNMLLDENFQIA